MPIPHKLGLFFQHPDMFIQKVDFETAAAFIHGFDVACNLGVLVGFREWLILKLEHGNNFAWPQLFLHFAFPESDAPSTQELPKADQNRLIGLLSEVLEAFWKEKDTTGLQRIFVRHAEWLKTQEWYREENSTAIP